MVDLDHKQIIKYKGFNFKILNGPYNSVEPDKYQM